MFVSIDKTAKKRPTIREVAAIAGVSRGTVSRVLNGGHWVSPAAEEAVLKAIESTGYRTNQLARGLATGRTGSIAFLLTEPHSLLFADPVFSILLRGAAEALNRRNMTLNLLVASTKTERVNVRSYVSAGHVDGVLLISSHENESLLHDLLEDGVPTVACGLPLGFQDIVASVSVDEIQGARTMLQHLRSRGRKRIAMITGPLDTPGGLYRLAGYKEEMGADFDESLVAYGDYSLDSGVLAMSELLERHPDLDAVFCASDLMATGALTALQKSGRSVPEDVSVGGFDDGGLAQTLNPPLTTMRQPFDKISEEMVKLLLELLDGGQPKAVTLPVELIEREST